MKNMKILLVDDEERFLATTQKILSKKGVAVRTATSGPAALQILESTHIHVVILDAKMPDYLDAPKPSTADSVQYSLIFWSGMFRREVIRLADKKIKDVMSPAPRTIDAVANLMEAAYTMISQNKRRLTIMDAGKVIGIIREQDLFFEIEMTHMMGTRSRKEPAR